MKRAMRRALLTMLVVVFATSTWTEARGQADLAELARQVRLLQDQVRLLHEAACSVYSALGISGFCKLIILPSKTIFVTGVTYNGNLGGLAGADAKCEEIAHTSLVISGHYKAWLSDSQTHARDRLTHHNGPYRLPNGELVALDWDDLVDGALLHAITVSQGGSGPGDNLAYTATNPDGTLQPPIGVFGNCGDWTTTAAGYSGFVGLVHWSDSNWTQASGVTCPTKKALYCIEQ